MINLDEIRRRSKEAGLSPKLNGSKVWANCPAHEGGNRHLRFFKKDNSLIMKCRGGCTKNQMRATVRNTLKLSPDDLVLKSKKTSQQGINPEKAGKKIILRASPDRLLKGEPGEYSVECINGKMRKLRNGKFKIILVFRVISGQQEGSIVIMWIDLGGKNVWVTSAYSKAACIALGRDTRPDEDLSPETVFVGKKFLAQVGWRRRDPRGKKAKKRDFLRVHWLLRLLEHKYPSAL